jgi:O-antigen/teichoic acid export membrane protein
MKKFIKSTIAHPFFSSSVVMLVGTNSINAINYLYHVIMGRVLGPADYGELASFFSLISLLSVIPLSFGTVIIKFVAASKNDQEVTGYLKWFIKPVLITAFVLGLGTAFSSFFLAEYLNTPHIWGIILIAISFLFSLPAYLFRSILQGLIKFHLVVISLISETAIKLLAGVLLVLIGWGVMGAMTGLFVSIITGWGISYFFLRSHLNINKTDKIDRKGVLKFTFPVLIQTLAMTSLMSADLIMVKHYFPSFEAGIYAAVATLGKIILFASAPVSTVMFPLVTQKYARQEGYISVFVLSIVATMLVVSGVIVIYFLFPQFIMGLLYGDRYLSGISLLVPYAFFTGLLSVASLFINLFLSTNHTKVVAIPFIAALVQLVGISFLHNSIHEVVWVSIAVATLLFIALSVYFLRVVIPNGYKIIKK